MSRTHHAETVAIDADEVIATLERMAESVSVNDELANLSQFYRDAARLLRIFRASYESEATNVNELAADLDAVEAQRDRMADQLADTCRELEQATRRLAIYGA